MPYDPNMLSQGSADAGSPLTAVLQYLSTKGYSPNAGNIKAALEANARDPGVIPGLRNAGVEDSAPAPSAGPARPVVGRTPVNEINQSVMPGDRPPGTGNAPPPPPPAAADSGGGGMGLLGTLGALIASAGGAVGLQKLLAPGGGAPPVADGTVPPTPTPDPVAEASKPGTTSAPPESPQDAAMRKATDGAPVEGVNKVDPNKVAGRAQGPTTPVEGDPVPMMPPTSSARVPPQPPPNMPPGAARTQAFQPRLGPRIVRPPLPRL